MRLDLSYFGRGEMAREPIEIRSASGIYRNARRTGWVWYALGALLALAWRAGRRR